jgi:DNA replication protein DnaC
MPNEITTADLPSKAVSCHNHGIFTSTGTLLTIGRMQREMWSICPKCSETNDTQSHMASAERSATAAQERLAKVLQLAAIPKRLLASSFNNYETSTDAQAATLARCMHYAEGFARHLDQGTGLVLAGKPGTGKSHLASAILQALMPTHVGAYTTMMDLVHSLREGWGGKGMRSEAHVLAELARLPLLVIDEIGLQYGTEAEKIHLFEVLDRRHRDMTPTILITNQDRAGFKGFVGDRIADRLTETASWIQCDWPSHRVAARQALAARD